MVMGNININMRPLVEEARALVAAMDAAKAAGQPADMASVIAANPGAYPVVSMLLSRMGPWGENLIQRIDGVASTVPSPAGTKQPLGTVPTGTELSKRVAQPPTGQPTVGGWGGPIPYEERGTPGQTPLRFQPIEEQPASRPTPPAPWLDRWQQAQAAQTNAAVAQAQAARLARLRSLLGSAPVANIIRSRLGV